MKILISCVIAVLLCGIASAQEYKSRRQTAAEERRVAGVSDYIQDVFLRNNAPIVVGTNEQPVYTIGVSNKHHGLYIISPTNAELSATFTIALPNPTNNLYRTFRFLTPDGCHIVLSNNWGTGSANGFRDLKTFGVSNVVWLVTSNKVATLYSTGTNYLVNVNAN